MVQQVDRGKVRVGSHHPRVLPATKGLKHDGRSARLRVPRRPRAPKVVPAQPKQTSALARLPEPCVVRSARHRAAPEDLASLTDLRVREDVRRMLPQAALEDCDGVIRQRHWKQLARFRVLTPDTYYAAPEVDVLPQQSTHVR